MKLGIFKIHENNMQKCGESECIAGLKEEAGRFAASLRRNFLTEIPVVGGKSVDDLKEITGRIAEGAGLSWSGGYIRDGECLYTRQFFKRAVLDHCVVAAICTLEEIVFLGYGHKITAYRLAKDLRDAGPLEARKLGLISEEGRCRNDKSQGKVDVNGATNAIYAIRQRMTEGERSTFFDDEKETADKSKNVNNIRMANYDIVRSLWKMRHRVDYTDRGFFMNKLHKVYDKKDGGYQITADEYLNHLERIMETEAFPKIPRSGTKGATTETKADFAVWAYKLERFYNLGLHRTVLCKVNAFKETHGWFSRFDELVDVLAKVSAMPNTFSRDVIIEATFDKLEKELACEIDKNDAFSKWKVETREFLSYLSTILIPLCERTFLTLLVRNYSIDSTHDLWRIVDDLAAYIGDDNNFEILTEPCITYKEGEMPEEEKIYGHTTDLLQISQKASKIKIKDHHEIWKRAYHKSFDLVCYGIYTQQSWKQQSVTKYNYGFKDRALAERYKLNQKGKEILLGYIQDRLEMAGVPEDSIQKIAKYEPFLYIVQVKNIGRFFQNRESESNEILTKSLYALSGLEEGVINGKVQEVDAFDDNWVMINCRKECLEALFRIVLDKSMHAKAEREHLSRKNFDDSNIIQEKTNSVKLNLHRR